MSSESGPVSEQDRWGAILDRTTKLESQLQDVCMDPVAFLRYSRKLVEKTRLRAKSWTTASPCIANICVELPGDKVENAHEPILSLPVHELR